MARPTRPKATARTVSGNAALAVEAAQGPLPTALASSAAVYRPNRKVNPKTDKASIAQPWQVEVYRQLNICGEARYASTLFANMAGRAELGISEPQSLARKATWVKSGPEVDALAELAPTVRERTKLIRDFMLHYVAVGECYLISREITDVDPVTDLETTEYVWEVVAVTELQKIGSDWKVRHDNGNYVDLSPDDAIIRMWNPDPSNRREAWSPFRSLLPTLREIEWLTKHIFTQVRSRLMSAGVWFLPDNLTFPPPPPDAVEGGAETIATMNEAEQFMLSLASSSMDMLDGDEVSFPSIVMADPVALGSVDQSKLIQFWSEIDDKAMTLRSDAVRRFALGMDLPPEQVLGSSGLAVTGAGGSAGSVNHWGVWANEEQTISAHIEPALDMFVGTLTSAYLRSVVDGTDKVIAYDTASLRLRQDRSKEAIELYDRGLLNAKVTLREVGFDPESDIMGEDEHKKWILNHIAKGSATPEQVWGALAMLGVDLPALPAPPVAPGEGVEGMSPAERKKRDGDGDGILDEGRGRRSSGVPSGVAPRISDRSGPPSLEGHPYEGPPRVDHEHNDAPFNTLAASAEALVLRALEKFGNRLLNNGKRGRDKDRTTPAHLAHVVMSVSEPVDPQIFDFSLADTLLAGVPAADLARTEAGLRQYCADLVQNGEAYSREVLIETLTSVRKVA